jgi:hypothetical protein
VSYRETSNYGKAVKRGIIEPKPPHTNRKKPKVRGPWKVILSLYSKEYVMHACETRELAEKMVRKNPLRGRMRIEFKETP